MSQELNNKDIRTVGIILAIGILIVIFCLFWAARTISAQEKVTTSTGTTFWVGRPEFAAPSQDKPKVKATGITLHGCKSATVYLTIKGGHLLAPMWVDKATVVPMANPAICDYNGKLTFYVLPSQDYEIEVTKPEAK